MEIQLRPRAQTKGSQRNGRKKEFRSRCPEGHSSWNPALLYVPGRLAQSDENNIKYDTIFGLSLFSL